MARYLTIDFAEKVLQWLKEKKIRDWKGRSLMYKLQQIYGEARMLAAAKKIIC